MPVAERRFTARKRPRIRRVVITVAAAALAAGALAVRPPVAGAATPCQVTNPAAGASYSSLQDAVNAAPGGAQLLVFGTCTGTTTISTNLTITGRADPLLHRGATLNGGGQGSVLTIEPGATVTLNDLTITCGNAPRTDGINGFGGGIYNYGGTVTLNNSVVSGNTAVSGGGIANDGGIMTLTDSVVRGNTAANGGGIFNFPERTGPFPTVTLNGTTSVSGNTSSSSAAAAAGGGGGIWNGGTVTLNDTVTVSRNTAGAEGGGIWNAGTVTFTFRATVSGNTAQSFGGGIRNYGGTLNSAYAGINVFGNHPDDIA
jgi:hypothetical protein